MCRISIIVSPELSAWGCAFADPHEEELLFPPCTSLSTVDVAQRGTKRCVLLSAQVSTNRPDVSELATPDHVPGSAAACAWLAKLLGVDVQELAQREAVDLSKRNLSHAEQQELLALAIGRGWRLLPQLRSVNLCNTDLGASGAARLAEALVKASLTSLK